MATRRRRFTAAFKKRVALEALRGEQPVQAIAAKHQVHPNQVSAWKRQAVEGLDEVFSGSRSKGRSEHEETIRALYAKIGELTVERDFFLHGEECMLGVEGIEHTLRPPLYPLLLAAASLGTGLIRFRPGLATVGFRRHGSALGQAFGPGFCQHHEGSS